jgi:L-amino acid N-acyltransferase YncA
MLLSGKAILRPATEADLPGILAIYNDAVLNTTASWNETVVDLDDRRAWLALRRAQNYPVLIAEAEGAVAGYASFGDFRPFDAYRHTVEHSVYVAAGARGRGLGRALVQALFPLALDRGKAVMIGGIDAANRPSLAMHERLGFRETGRLPGVGRKFGRSLDLVLMQKELG